MTFLIKIKSYIYYFKNSIFIFLGGLMVISFLWLRFLRERLPKDIPFSLSLIGLLVILYICIIYIYIIVKLYNPSKVETNNILKDIIISVFKQIIEKVILFDQYLKNISFIKNHYQRIINIINNINYNNLRLGEQIDLIFNIVIPLILCLTFYIDVFYFHKLCYFYKIIPLGLIMYLGPYLIYSLHYLQKLKISQLEKYIPEINTAYVPGVLPREKDFITYVEEYTENDFPEDMDLPLKLFIEYQVNSIFYDDIEKDFIIIYNDAHRKKLFIEHNLPKKDYFTDEEYDLISQKDISELNQIIRMGIILEAIDCIKKHSEFSLIIKNIKILIYINYLGCWIYILVVSLTIFESISIPLDDLFIFIMNE